MPHTSASLPTSSTRDFTAVLLAGGRSTRMGSDKAALVIDGKPLWLRQLETLRATDPGELFISGRADGPYVEAGVHIVVDDLPDLGPLGGMATALRVAKYPLVLVLAVDLPEITSAWLRDLVRAGPTIPINGGKLEPLAAVYPKAAAGIAERLVRQRRLAMRAFAEELFAAGLATPHILSQEEVPLFRNLNTLEDLRNRTSGL